MESRNDRPEVDFYPNPIPRHIMLSSVRGMVMEMERVGVAPGAGEQYIFRRRKASTDAGTVFHSGTFPDPSSWVGFCYRESHWSFVKPARP